MVGFFEAGLQGFASFFSIWQACIAQISPFFMAFIIGLYFMAWRRGAPPSMVRRTVFPSVIYMAGFSAPYALMTATGLPVGRLMAYHSGTLSVIAGIVILLIGLFMTLYGRVAFITKLDTPLYIAFMSLLLGIAFALVYSPCITPTLSKIMGIASQPKTAMTGAILAFFYAVGICVAFLITGVVLVRLLSSVGVMRRNPGRVKDSCGAILCVLAFLNISGTMILYKAFVLGFFVK
ncbi:MAG: hypothetical protein A3G18_00165 [Rhodospirillales bacterium RIFCSPLOWO2_12_FULL_58_28]|nr:MAG: hypothetical protein A3H92_02775 [Rhodospirillales bacterium RIFCSPLOWO2_02_FULL_58_16]OHC79882.1 MAG: hypothetical protein A3G18_00165 [Rhodospirillales bacterium RIFCSPLOWO2_12_FULL_58_28]